METTPNTTNMPICAVCDGPCDEAYLDDLYGLCDYCDADDDLAD
jgi:hypothetical protein